MSFAISFRVPLIQCMGSFHLIFVIIISCVCVCVVDAFKLSLLRMNSFQIVLDRCNRPINISIVSMQSECMRVEA